MQRAKHFGVVIDRATGQVRRVFNPDFEFEFGGHHLDADEYMLRVEKEYFGVSAKPNSMTLDQFERIKLVFEK